MKKLKKFLLSSSVAALLLPAFALAAFNDVTLTTNAILSVGGISVTVTGSPTVIESIIVSADSFAATFQNSSNMRVHSPAGTKLTTNAQGPYIVSNTCTASGGADLELAPTSASTITVTPSTASCASGSSGAPISGGGGGGGGGGGTITPVTPVTPTTPAPVVVTTPAAGGDKAALITALTAQLNSLLAQIAVLTGKPVAVSAGVSFSRDLKLGSSGADVKALQVYLNTHGFVIAAKGAGSTGNETTKFGGLTKAALIKFQKAKGITPAAGYFGAKTRGYIAANP